MRFASIISVALAALGPSDMCVAAAPVEADSSASHPDISGRWVAKPYKVHRYFYKTGESEMLYNSTSALDLQQDGCHLWGSRSWEDVDGTEGDEALVGSFLGGPEDHIRFLSIIDSDKGPEASLKEASVHYDGTQLHYVVIAYTIDEVGVSFTAVFEREE